MKKGILLIAVGHKNYLGMALNLAASIRVSDPGLAIALATDNPAPAIYQDKLFDMQVQVTPEMITHDGAPAFIKSKLHMLDLSPFDETIFLDADQVMITNRSLTPIFNQLAGIDVTFSNTGPDQTTFWADYKEMMAIYGKDQQNWSVHSEFVYFKKTKVAKDFFKAAKKVYKEQKIKSAITFGGAPMADELAFQCAMMITGTYPHQEKWTPNFWYAREKALSRKNPYELTGFLTYSIGGNNTPPAVKRHYQNLADHFFRVLGLRNAYKIQDKMTFLTNRKTV